MSRGRISTRSRSRPTCSRRVVLVGAVHRERDLQERDALAGHTRPGHLRRVLAIREAPERPHIFPALLLLRAYQRPAPLRDCGERHRQALLHGEVGRLRHPVPATPTQPQPSLAQTATSSASGGSTSTNSTPDCDMYCNLVRLAEMPSHPSSGSDWMAQALIGSALSQQTKDHQQKTMGQRRGAVRRCGLYGRDPVSQQRLPSDHRLLERHGVRLAVLPTEVLTRLISGLSSE